MAWNTSFRCETRNAFFENEKVEEEDERKNAGSKNVAKYSRNPFIRKKVNLDYYSDLLLFGIKYPWSTW